MRRNSTSEAKIDWMVELYGDFEQRVRRQMEAALRPGLFRLPARMLPASFL